jgi:hypothetical protein
MRVNPWQKCVAAAGRAATLVGLRLEPVRLPIRHLDGRAHGERSGIYPSAAAVARDVLSGRFEQVESGLDGRDRVYAVDLQVGAPGDSVGLCPRAVDSASLRSSLRVSSERVSCTPRTAVAPFEVATSRSSPARLTLSSSTAKPCSATSAGFGTRGWRQQWLCPFVASPLPVRIVTPA